MPTPLMATDIVDLNIPIPAGDPEHKWIMYFELGGIAFASIIDTDNDFSSEGESPLPAPAQMSMVLTIVPGRTLDIPEGYTVEVKIPVDGEADPPVTKTVTITFRSAITGSFSFYYYIDTYGELFADEALTIPADAKISVLTETVGSADDKETIGDSVVEDIGVKSEVTDASGALQEAVSVEDSVKDSTLLRREKLSVSDQVTTQIDNWGEDEYPTGNWEESL